MMKSNDWNIIPIGESKDTGELITYNVKFAPHTINIGSMGSGSSIINRAIFSHLLEHSDKWRYFGIDPMGMWLQPYKKYCKLTSRISVDAEYILYKMKTLSIIMDKRYKALNDEKVVFFEQLKNSPKALYINIYYYCKAYKKISSELGEEEAKEFEYYLGKIARMGRSAGLYLNIVESEKCYNALSSELRNNLENKIISHISDKNMLLDYGYELNHDDIPAADEAIHITRASTNRVVKDKLMIRNIRL